jgi:hypothetical protein
MKNNKIQEQSNALILPAVGPWTGGKRSIITMNVIHETATAPIRVDQRPRLNGPGSNLACPDVIRKNMGAA